MYQFFTNEDFSKKILIPKELSYIVAAGRGVMLRANENYSYVYTSGLRTCVAFALINPQDHSAVLIHFYYINQIEKDLKNIVSTFIEKSVLSDMGLICVIAGGREFYDGSETMCTKLIAYAKEELLNIIHPIKLSLYAPITADDDETLSLMINLETGEYKMALCKENTLIEDSAVPMDHVDLTDLLDPQLFGYKR